MSKIAVIKELSETWGPLNEEDHEESAIKWLLKERKEEAFLINVKLAPSEEEPYQLGHSYVLKKVDG